MTSSTTRRIIALAGINASLVAAVVIVALSRDADGQAGVASVGRATYSMAGGNIDGTDMGVLHIVDETHQEMASVMWNDKQRTLTPIGFRNLAADSAGAGRLRP
ncbi:MAG: hypothetical protein EXS03_07835 [Phycisphaerales bacterium]|nr:hypothetical protein [Phycisphaerales bacterium]